MDILYIIGNGYSKCDHFELRMSLRSIEKFGINIDRVFVAGHCPEWLSDEVIKVPHQQPLTKKDMYVGQKHYNIMETMLYVVENTDIGEEFLISYDDHIYIKTVDFDNYPHFIKQVDYNLGNHYEFLPNTQFHNVESYAAWMVRSREELEKLGLPVYNCTPHRNQHVRRSTINELRDIIEEYRKRKCWDCEWFLLSLNYEYSKGMFEWTPVWDVRINNPSQWWKCNPRTTDVISTADFSLSSSFVELLLGLFPEKSKYELYDVQLSESKPESKPKSKVITLKSDSGSSYDSGMNFSSSSR